MVVGEDVGVDSGIWPSVRQCTCRLKLTHFARPDDDELMSRLTLTRVAG